MQEHLCEHGNGYVGEMKLVVKGGYTPMEAIVAATKYLLKYWG